MISPNGAVFTIRLHDVVFIFYNNLDYHCFEVLEQSVKIIKIFKKYLSTIEDIINIFLFMQRFETII